MMEVLFRRGGPGSWAAGGDRGERQASAVVIISEASVSLAWSSAAFQQSLDLVSHHPLEKF